MEYALIRGQSTALQQAFCSGPPPSMIEKVIARADADVSDSYAAWATDFVLLGDEYIAYVANCAPDGGWIEMFQRGWKPSEGNTYYRDVDPARLWVDKHPRGWIIELNHPGQLGPDGRLDPDARILTLARENMPILCATLPGAAQLADVSFPSPHYHVYWHSYW